MRRCPRSARGGCRRWPRSRCRGPDSSCRNREQPPDPRRNDEPQSILFREANKLGYGANSPYARQTEYATLNNITRDDLVALHKRFVAPNNIVLGFVGDFDSAAMEQKLREAKIEIAFPQRDLHIRSGVLKVENAQR